jgi:rSAM/selenodomain-associated transferase 1
MVKEECSANVLGLFAKRPEPGLVKTRLAAAASPEWAASVAEAFLLDTIERLGGVEARRVLAFAPAHAAAYFAVITKSRFATVPQVEGNLGEKMSAFFELQLRHAPRRVVLVGTDSPTLPLGYVAQAFESLDEFDVVIGPATDGGYYLIGCRQWIGEMFDSIPWGTSRVLADTISRLRSSGLRAALLPPWYDVDTLDDWYTLKGHAAALRYTGEDPGIPHTEALLMEAGPRLRKST